jgi:dTMP kinase
MKRFIVTEGLDGAGKSTQIKQLQDYLTKQGINYKYIHFPQTDAQENSPIYGEMVANFLKGEYGDVEIVNPYLVALLYAGDRNNAKNRINEWLEKDYFVIVDRYVYSNMAFQGAKFSELKDKQTLKQWIHTLEYEHNKIPKPNLSIFLHMDFEFISQKLKDARDGRDRNYLEGKADIHESSLDLQKNVENEYLRLVREENDFHRIDCFNNKGNTLKPEKIHQKIIQLLKDNNMLK